MKVVKWDIFLDYNLCQSNSPGHELREFPVVNEANFYLASVVFVNYATYGNEHAFQTTPLRSKIRP